MKNVFLCVFLTHVMLLTSLSSVASKLPDKILKEQITLLSGEQTNLARYVNKQPVYLKFWATWCQPCLKEMPHFQHVQQQHGDKIKVISINIGINDDVKSVNAVIDKYGLTMPTTIDKSGDLAKAFNFIGTPYHLLFDKQMNLVHLGHEATESLDNKLALLAQQKPVELLDTKPLTNVESNMVIPANNEGLSALFFTAAWCDWYLADSRPEASKNCIDGQRGINEYYRNFTNINWHGIVSRLWTSEADLKQYKKKYNIKHPINIDKSNQLFHQYKVNKYPTLILLKGDQVVFRTSNFSHQAHVKNAAALTKLVP